MRRPVAPRRRRLRGSKSSLRPSASAANTKRGGEIDLSPGTRRRPATHAAPPRRARSAIAVTRAPFARCDSRARAGRLQLRVGVDDAATIITSTPASPSSRVGDVDVGDVDAEPVGERRDLGDHTRAVRYRYAQLDESRWRRDAPTGRLRRARAGRASSSESASRSPAATSSRARHRVLRDRHRGLSARRRGSTSGCRARSSAGWRRCTSCRESRRPRAATARGAPPRASVATSINVDEASCGTWLTSATKHVVIGGRHRRPPRRARRAGANAATRARGLVGCGSRREHPRGADEEVGTRRLDAILFRTGHRMPAEDAAASAGRSRSIAATSGPFTDPTSVTSAAPASSACTAIVDNRADGTATNTTSAVRAASSTRARDDVIAPSSLARDNRSGSLSNPTTSWSRPRAPARSSRRRGPSR